MEAHLVFATRDLGWISAASHDRPNYGVLPRIAGRRAQRHAIADVQAGVGGQAFVDGDATRRARLNSQRQR